MRFNQQQTGPADQSDQTELFRLAVSHMDHVYGTSVISAHGPYSNYDCMMFSDLICEIISTLFYFFDS